MAVQTIAEQLMTEKRRAAPSGPRLSHSLRIRAERVLMQLLYATESDWLHRLPDGSCVIRAGHLAKAFRWRSYDIYIHLDHLKDMGYLEAYDRQIGKGLTLVRVRPPAAMTYRPELQEVAR